MKTFILSFLLFLIALPAFADIANEDEVDLNVELMNGEKFEGYTFFVRYQTYYYEYGYQPGMVNEVDLKPGENYAVSGRGGSSKIYARDEKGNEFESEEEVGGVVNYSGNGVSVFIDRYKVVSVKDGKIELKHVERVKQLRSGKLVKVNKAGLDFDGNGFPWMSFALPLVSFLALIAFFIFRRKAAARS